MNANLEKINLSNIKKLKLYSDCIKYEKIKTLQLEELIITVLVNYKQVLDYLPQTLKKLTIYQNNNMNISFH